MPQQAAAEDQRTAVGRDRRVGVAEGRGCGLVNCLFSPVSSETTNNASGFPSPGESVTTRQLLSGHQARIRRIAKACAYADLGHFALRPAQWRDQPQFARCRRLPVTLAKKGDPAAVGRPDRVVVAARVGGQPQRRAGADLLHVDVGIVLLWPGPRERHVVAVGENEG